jgi:hypothetical protein
VPPIIGVYFQKFKTAATSPLCWASQKGVSRCVGRHRKAYLMDEGTGATLHRWSYYAKGGPVSSRVDLQHRSPGHAAQSPSSSIRDRFRFHFAETQLLIVIIAKHNYGYQVHLWSAKNFDCHAAFVGPVMRFGLADGGAAATDLMPLTISNCLRHLLIAASKRSWVCNSFRRPPSVAASPISTNS